MKKIIGFLVISIIAFSIDNVMAGRPEYQANVKQLDSNMNSDRVIGYMNSKGHVVDENGNAIGRVTSENTVVPCKREVMYITCAYTREIDWLGKATHTILGDEGLHYQLIVYDKNAKKAIGAYGKTQKVDSGSIVTFFKYGKISQSEMEFEFPNVEKGYNPIPKWCIESDSVSVPSLGPFWSFKDDKDCRDYSNRVKTDLCQNHGGKEVNAPEFALLEVKVKQSHDTIVDMPKQISSNANSSHPDLHSLNLDDPNGDWCKCEERGEKPGCKANMDPVKGYVFFGCTKCKKVNVKYAKMALELEQKMKDAGVQGTWFGQNAKANAHKAASEPSK